MSNDTVDPELLPLVAMMPGRPLSAATLAEDRAMMKAMHAAYVRPSDDGIVRSERFVPGPQGAPDLRLVIYARAEREAAPAPVLFVIHGGGFVGGSADNSEGWTRLVVSRLGCVVVSVDYRLAPEHPYPAAIEDCYAALLWLNRAGAALNVDPARVAVEGVSAGGALAASLALMVRDRGEVAIASLSLIYPMLDDRASIGPRDPRLGQIAWFYDSNAFGWRALLGEGRVGATDVPAYAAPARAEDLAGLPPTYVGAAGLDMLVYENIDFARRLIAAGVPTRLEVWPRVFHGFDVGNAASSRAFKEVRLDVIARGLGIGEKQA